MRKPGFGVVSLVVVVVTALGLLAKVAAPYLPQPEPNNLAAEGADFLRQGGRERIDWRVPSEETFALARRLNRPILFLVGVDYSQTGRFTDNQIFSDPEVQALLARNLVCIRVDGVDHPEWLHTFLPISRARLPFTPGFQMWMLDPSGQQYDFLSPLQVDQFNARSFLDLVLNSLRKLERLRKPDSTDLPPGAAQAADVKKIQTIQPDAAASIDDFTEGLLQAQDAQFGGFPTRNSQYLHSPIYRYLLACNQLDTLTQALKPLLSSAMVDWLDGGFFRASLTRNWSSIQVDKVSAANAEMAYVLAALGRLTNDPFYTMMARRIVDGLLNDLSRNGYIMACRKGDDGLQNRSRRSSFSIRFLRDLRISGDISEQDLNFARTHLGLRVEENPQMLIKIKDRSIFEGDMGRATDRVLGILKKSRQDFPRALNRGRYLDVNGYVCARLLAVARLTGDQTVRQRARDLATALEEFRAGDDVIHSLDSDRASEPSLGDYLAYAETMFELFLTDGTEVSLQNGLQVLSRARFLFGSENPGVWNIRVGEKRNPWPPNTVTTDIFDFEIESLTARMIRVCRNYSRLQSDADISALLAIDFESAIDRLAHLAPELGIGGAGLMTCVRESMPDRPWAFTVGPNAVEQSMLLGRRVPLSLVAPAVGSVRKDLQSRGPGVYVVTDVTILGPLSFLEAEKHLAP